MAVTLGIWHLVLEGGKEQVILTPASVQITNVSFGEEIADESSRTVVKMSFESLGSGDEELDEEKADDEDEDEENGLKIATTVLCALTPGKIEQVSVNLVLDENSSFKFEATGKNTVYLTGNYIDQHPYDDPPSDDEGFDSDDSEGHDLLDVSSDVEMYPDELDGLDSDASRFEEVDDEPTKGQKRARESDAAGDEKPNKAEKKAKKIKAEGGVAIPVESASAPKAEKKKEKKDKKSGEEGQKKADGEKKKEEPAKKTLPSGVIIQDAKVGTGPMAKKGNTVRMRYIGKFTNGKEFDKNTSGKPFTFHLGKGEVIKGWDEGIVGMQAGGERLLTVPASMGYGKKGTDGIPPNSTLVFEVKLLEIK